MTDVEAIFDKGIILGPTINKDRYICPDTGAHFEYLDMFRRLKRISNQREKFQEQEDKIFQNSKSSLERDSNQDQRSSQKSKVRPEK